MADEIEASVSLRLKRSDIDEILSKIGLQFDQTGSEFTYHVQTIGITEEAIELGEISSLGYYLAINLDTTNFVSLRAGTGLGNFHRLDANYGFSFGKWGSGATAPFAIADTAACRVLFLILEA
jgi:hypothetical protein